MIDDESLQNQLNRPQVPQELEARLRLNWREQLIRKRSPFLMKHFAAVAGLCGVILAVLIVNNVHTTTHLVNAAIRDIHGDARNNVGISVPVASITDVANFNYPPKTMKIEMTKYCVLDGNKTMHLKIAGEKRGEVHLFITGNGFNTSFEQDHMGSIENMPWKLIEPRKGLSVLVVYSHDMDPDNVEKLIQTMFYT